MSEVFRAILQGFRVQDCFDIAIISLLIYALLIWFKETASRFVLVGIGVLGTVYILARFFQLYMTAVVLQGFFAILLVALVVIFQEELRRFFERLALLWQMRKGAVGPAYRREVELVTQTAISLAQKRVGALIVIQGDEPLGRHLEGGTPLDGFLSQPLLESIFDPHSVGHDGAVIINRGRVVRFGCHLPLSLSTNRFRQVGLRHTAALGLAERSDALCIVVSEERGTVSVAKEERIIPLTSPKELNDALEGFYARRVPREKPRGLIDKVRKNFWDKAAAILVASLLWLTFGYQSGSISRYYTIPIEYRDLPAQWIMEEPRITVANVMLKGTEQAFRLLDSKTLKVSLDLSNIREGKHPVVLTREMIQIPSNLSLEAINPDTIRITTYKLLPTQVPIEVTTKGTPPQGRKLHRIEVSPSSVRVLIPSTLRDKTMRIQTEPIDLGQLTRTTTIIPSLIFPQEIHFVDEKPPSVKVTIEIEGTSTKSSQ